MTDADSPRDSLAGADNDSRSLGRNVPLVILFALVLSLAAYSAGLRQRPGPPGDGSVDAGFARDMSVHHAQAVQMAEAVRFRTADPAIRTLATDIVLSQQAQIGQMTGWLETWGLPATGRRPAMAWMGHERAGNMPGMAAPTEVVAIVEAPVAQAEVRFLQAMIGHHQGGVTMAEGLLARGGRGHVRRLAEKMAAAQQAEIQAMSELLQARGVPPAALAGDGDPPATATHG